MANRASNDQLLAVWVLKRLGWSFRRIARLKLPSSHHTVTDYYEMGYEMVKSGELPILAKSERALRIMSLGKSSDVEYIEGKEHHKPSGGGKRVTPHIFDDEFKDIGNEE